ncbi:MAG: cysteine--tRNA ligase [Pseudomonadota bacterium]
MREIRLWNTRDKAKQPIVPDAAGHVGMYVCGPTVYDRAHIGNARPVVVFDVLYRLLRHLYGPENVTYVRNFTDVDDKIIKRADESGRPIGDITAETTQWYLDDMAALGTLEPDHMPRATDYVNAPEQPTDMVRLIETLIEKGHAYAAEGHVLFAVESWDGYGTLSHRDVDEMIAGARVDVAPYKKGPMDFVLWKPSTPDQPGWDGPRVGGEIVSRGRPGWHIECSAMAKAILGERFQIHGGGIDLAFPHHENERAQSCCANGTPDMADIWVHNGYLMVEGEKMSKSLGNFFTVKDLLDRGIPGEVMRLLLLGTHYRQPLDWTEKRVEQADTILRRWRRAVDAAAGTAPAERFEAAVEAVADDLNTWNAIRAVDEEAKALLSTGGAGHAERFLAGLALLGFEGLEGAETQQAQRLAAAGDPSDRIEALLAARAEARKAKDFATADGIRTMLTAAGVEVRDGQTPPYVLTDSFDAAKLEATA